MMTMEELCAIRDWILNISISLTAIVKELSRKNISESELHQLENCQADIFKLEKRIMEFKCEDHCPCLKKLNGSHSKK